MSRFVHVKDDFGNDLWFGDCGQNLRICPYDHIRDYSTQLDRVRNVQLRPDDVVLVGLAKSGTNWVHQMVSMLVAGSNDLPEIGFSNFILLDAVSEETQLPSPDKPRVLTSHFLFRFLPRDVVEKKVKVVFFTRNLKDVFVSLFCYLKNMDRPFGYPGTWPQFFTLMLKEGHNYGNAFDFMRDWEKEMESHPEHPIYHCGYEDTKQDVMKQLEGLNQFLGLNRSREFLREVADACHFKKMTQTRRVSKEMSEMFRWKEEVPTSSFYRKGVVGDWKNWFTVAQNEEFEKVYATKMAGSKLSFVYE